MLFDKCATPDEIDQNIKNIINNCFDTINLKLKIDGIISDLDSEENEEWKQNKYKITKLLISDKNFNENSKMNHKVSEIVNKINNQLTSGKLNKNWNIFYFYKEFIQQFKKLGFNYFRGQTDKWELIPSFCRHNQYNLELIKNFENIYRNIAEELEEIEYFPFSNINQNSCSNEIDMQFSKRNTKLGVLQHYGFPTPLVDITSNPYIALLFMCDEKDSYAIGKSKRLDLFKINTINDAENNIFSSVFLGTQNKRIKAQKGEFLDFSKYDIIKNISKIPHIVLELDYSTVDYKISSELYNFILKTIIKPKSEYSMIKRRIEKENDKFDPETLQSIKNAFSSSDNRLEFIYNAINWKNEKDLASLINQDLSTKLKEFNYTEKLMFPDTYNQLQFIKKEYEHD